MPAPLQIPPMVAMAPSLPVGGGMRCAPSALVSRPVAPRTPTGWAEAASSARGASWGAGRPQTASQAPDAAAAPAAGLGPVLGLGAALAAGAAALQTLARRSGAIAGRGRTTMGIRKRPLPLIRSKVVTATRRLPLWKFSDEMYLHRQLAPNPDTPWTDIQRAQARMREQVLDQQKRDMKSIERELSGFRLEPTYPIGELREGMWLDGRVSGTSNFGVWVDIGAYTERGEWIDGYLHIGQMRDDGKYLMNTKMMDAVHLGERVRVRVREVVPSTGTLKLSMRTVEDLPPLFLGKPRPYSLYDLQEGMKVVGIVRRVWDKWAIVDIGADRLARLHVRNHKRAVTPYGFYKLGQKHLFAYTAFARGAQLDLWISKVDNNLVQVTCNKPRSLPRVAEVTPRRPGVGIQGVQAPPPKEERITRAQKREREKSAAEKAPYEPYVAYVDEWLEEAMEPDEDTDSWVARTENELFGEMKAEGLVPDDDEEDEDGGRLGSIRESEEEEFQEQFADDEFAEDDFADDAFKAEMRQVGFGPNAFPASELEGWVLDDSKPGELASGKGDALTEEQLEEYFDADEEESNDNRGGSRWPPGKRPRYGGAQPPRR